MAFRHPQTRQPSKSQASEPALTGAILAEKIEAAVEEFLNTIPVETASTDEAPAVEETPVAIVEPEVIPEPVAETAAKAAPAKAPEAPTEPKRRGPKPGFKKAVKTSA